MLLHVLKSQMSLILSILNVVIVAIKDKLYSHTFVKIVIHSPYCAKRVKKNLIKSSSELF